METLTAKTPLAEQTMITAGLDYYKPTMSQLAYEKEPDAEVTFTFKNRGEQRLLDYIDPADLQARFEEIRARGFSEDELDYLSGLQRSNSQPVFSAEYLDYLQTAELPEVNIGYDEEKDDIAIETTGNFPAVTFWETVVMSEVNEAYFESYLQAHDINPIDVYDEGDRRLSEKIAVLQQNPDIKFADFGTRRRFSLKWQKHVLERLQNECPENLTGTSNVALAKNLGMTAVGTFAHEMPMVYAGLADSRGEDIRASHHKFLEDWRELYGDDLSTALTDTFGSEFFFADFTPEQARAWKSLRHDSGDPFEFGERVIEFYENNGIDPQTKTIVFSDGLDMETILSLHEHFKGCIGNIYGWGTTLTNDLGLDPLNIVMKATEVNGTGTVKLSDNPGKHTGNEENIQLYKNVFAT